jgi:signal transduction histidine kinase
MKRLRIAFVLLALALAVPLGLLVSRALASVSLERATQHRAVAERVFDEMERALSRFLEREEDRPFEEYRAPLPGQRRPTASLAHVPGEPFMAGHFQIDPGGSFHTPVLDGPARDEGGITGKEDARAESAATLEHLVLQAWAVPPRERPSGIVGTPDDEMPPGTTIEHGRAAKKRTAAAMKSEQEKDANEAQLAAKAEPSSAFELLRSLNRAGEERAERKQKVTQAPYSEVYGGKAFGADRPAPSSVVGRIAAASSRRVGAFAKGQPIFAQQTQSREGSGAPSPSDRYGDSVASAEVATATPSSVPLAVMEAEIEEAMARKITAERSPRAAGTRIEADFDAGATATGEVRITLDPMVGRRVDSRYIVLSRTVLVGEQGYRQGFLVDTEALGRWLEERVLGSNGLAQLGHAWFLSPNEPVPAAIASGEFVYEHSFEEPFDSLRVLLALEPLPGTASTRTLYQLAGLVALLALGGLAAVYRMVAVVVSFAERRNQFVAAVSHELKTPLTSIRMYSEMLRDGVVPEGRQREDYYATIHGEAERLSRLIDNVLEFSRLERGSREFDFSVGDVGTVVREAAETLRPHVEREGFSLMIAVEEDLPPVRFDRDAVLQVLFNLVDNALKYARSASKHEIAITCLRENEGVALSVRDFGPGVPRRHHARIFEAFYRGENELTRSAKGSGIGLALVKELSEAMGAALQSGNAEGGGFRVSLRFAQAR